MRVILYTGKGGVGKTSLAAATACELARRGQRVLIMSTDQAHSLGDSFDIKLGKEPTKVMEHLDAMEIDAAYESEKCWGSMKGYLKRLLTANGGSDGIEVEELLVFPGLEELFSMFRILEFHESGQYDVMIVDCAPTGETLSLLKYPEKLENIIHKVLPAKRKAVKVAGPVVQKVTKIPMPEDNVFDDFEHLMDKMGRLQEFMLDHKQVSLRIVTTPEQIVIREAKRNFTCLYLYGYNVDAIFVNRIYPNKAMEGYFNKWMEMQAKGLQEVKESFSEVPKFYVELQKEELRTIPVLQKVGKKIFADCNPSEVLFEQEIYQVVKSDDGIMLKIYLPFANKKELELSQNKGELILAVKNEVRRFPLTNALLGKDIQGAKLEDGYLKIQF